MTQEELDTLALRAFNAAHEAYSVNKLQEILLEVRCRALTEAIACCQEVIDDRRQNGWKQLVNHNKKVPKIVAVEQQASGANSSKARIMALLGWAQETRRKARIRE